MLAAAGTTAAVLARGPKGSPGPNIVLLVAGFVALGVLLGTEVRRPRLPRRFVLGTSAALLVVAVAIPPTESNDVWAYSMYGRIVAIHHASPYTHSAASYPHDPFSRRVDKIWRHTASVYGPVFTAISALGMGTVGRWPLGARLFFQGLAALAALGALLLVDRHTRSPLAVALLGVNPLIVISVVNGAHNDALIGLAVLAGVLLAMRKRFGWAAVALALAALIKIAAVLPLAAVVMWVWHRYGRHDAFRMGAIGAGVILVGLALAGGPAALRPLNAAQQHITGASVWYGPRRWLTAAEIGRGLSGAAAGHLVRRAVSAAATVAAIGLTALLVARRLDHDDPAIIAGAAVLAYSLLGAYVLPWYVGWGLPALALAWRSRLTWLALLHGAFLHLAYVPDPKIAGHPVDKLYLLTAVERLQLDLYEIWVPLLELGVILVVVAMSARTPKWSLAKVPVNERSQITLADSTLPAPSSRRQPTRT
jgi:hypothetical protein